MSLNQKVSTLTDRVNWNYIGLVAGVLSVIVTVYNINKYWEEISKVEK